MPPRSRVAEAVVCLRPGETVTHLLLAVALDRTGGVAITPRVSAAGTHVPLPRRLLRGGGELVVTVSGDETRVILVGEPPAWPLSLRWRERTLRRLLGRSLVRLADPSSAG